MLGFPLTTAQFFDWLPVASISMDCPETVELSRTEDGDVLTADRGARLWQGTVTLGRLTADEAARAETIIDVLRSSAASFLAYDLRRPAPAWDPTGAILGAASVTLHTLAANNREARLQGLPAGYRLTVGDRLAFDYGSSPVRRALHRVVNTVVAAADGVTPTFELVPPIRPGAVVGAAVLLKKPSCYARLVPGSVEIGATRRQISEGTTFRYLQKLRP